MKITRQSNNQWHYKDDSYLVRGADKEEVRKVARALKNATDEEEEEKTIEERLDGLIQKAEEIENIDPEEIKELLDEVHELKEILEEPEDKTEDEKGIEELLKTNDADELEERRKSENEDSIEDEDEDVLKKRRIEGAKSVLEYKTASVDHFFQKLNYKISEEGDSFLMQLGCEN